MKKIAICLSGLPRCFNYHHDSLLNLFDPYKVDVFMHLWEDNLTSELKDLIIETWNPTDIEFEKQPKELFNQWIHDSSPYRAAGRFHGNVFPQRYSIYKANQLKCKWEEKNNFVYDAVCKLRVDLWANTKWTEALDKIKENTVIIPGDLYHGPFQDFDHGYNDCIAMGDSKTMDKFADIWNWFPTALEHKQAFGYEVMLRNYLDNWAKVNIDRHYLDFKIVRPDEKNEPYTNLRGSASIPPADDDLIR